jgi:cysteine desulfurase
MPRTPIYLDNHATTRVDPRVVEAMLPWFTERYGNPSSKGHRFGWEAEEAVEAARAEVARLITAEPREIVFTSGATESDNLAIRGVLLHPRVRGKHLVTTAIEHDAVLGPAAALARQGVEVTVLPVPPSGLVEVDRVAAAIRPDTALVSVMAANNEIGTIQPVGEIGRIARERGALMHSDAAQALGKIPLDVAALGVDLMSLSAHKVHGPKGVGALYIKRRGARVRIEPLVHGGGQEGGLRSGTLNVPGIVGFGRACAIAEAEMAAEATRLGALRDRLLARLQSGIDGVRVNGALAPRLPGNLNLAFPGVDGAALLVALKDIAVSSGAACKTGTNEPSHVLRAIGLGDELALSSLRFGIGRFNTEDEIDAVAAAVTAAVGRLREMAPRGAAFRSS